MTTPDDPNIADSSRIGPSAARCGASSLPPPMGRLHIFDLGPKRGRGKAADTIALGQIAHDVLADARSAMTLRQLYYALVSVGAIPKVEPSYDRLKRVMKDLREDRTIPGIGSSTTPGPCSRRGPSMVSRACYRHREALPTRSHAPTEGRHSAVGRVRLDRQRHRRRRRSLLRPDVHRPGLQRARLPVGRREGCRRGPRAGKTVHILHVGDFDPSGEDIYRDVEETLRLYAIAVDLDWPVADVRRYLLAELRQEGIDPAADLYGRSEWCWRNSRSPGRTGSRLNGSP